MYSAKAIANYFLDIGEVEGVPITPMQIIKLVYIAHGWHLALREEPLIVDKIEAWEFGPVIPSLYHEFKYYGSNPIESRAYEEVMASIYNEPDNVPVGSFLDEVWREYKGFDALELSSMTHQPNTPWDITRKKNRLRLKTNPIIDNDLIQKYYCNMRDAPYDEFQSKWYPF